MQNFLSTENKPYQFMMKLYQLIVLNLLFLVSCLPIFTIGAAWTAMYAVTLKMIEDKEENLIQTYLTHFKKDFKQSTIIWLTYVGFFIVFAFSYPTLQQLFQLNRMFFYLFILIATIGILTSLYVFPLLAKFENSNLGVLKRAIFLAMKHMTLSIILFFLFILFIIFIPIFFPELFFLSLMLGFSLNAYISSYVLFVIFNQYAEK